MRHWDSLDWFVFLFGFGICSFMVGCAIYIATG